MGILFLTSWEFQESDYVAANSLLFSSESTVYKFTSQWPRINELCPWSGLKTVARILLEKGFDLSLPFTLPYPFPFSPFSTLPLKARYLQSKCEIGKNHCKFLHFFGPQCYWCRAPNFVLKIITRTYQYIPTMWYSFMAIGQSSLDISWQALSAALWQMSISHSIWGPFYDVDYECGKMPFGPKPLNRSCWNLASIISFRVRFHSKIFFKNYK